MHSLGAALMKAVDQRGMDVAWDVFRGIGAKMKEIKNLPAEQQAEILGRIEGNIIGTLATGGAL